MQPVKFVPNGFCRISMVGDGFQSQSRGKDAIIVPAPEAASENEQVLRYYDCSCGSVRQVPGTIVEQEEARIVFEVNPGKRFILETFADRASRPAAGK